MANSCTQVAGSDLSDNVRLLSNLAAIYPASKLCRCGWRGARENRK